MTAQVQTTLYPRQSWSHDQLHQNYTISIYFSASDAQIESSDDAGKRLFMECIVFWAGPPSDGDLNRST